MDNIQTRQLALSAKAKALAKGYVISSLGAQIDHASALVLRLVVVLSRIFRTFCSSQVVSVLGLP
jgi:hypothetical protein